MLRTILVTVTLAVGMYNVSSGAVIEVGDLNIIDDPGNPSDGLRYLDMSFSDGLSLSAALANAQATYPDARLATPAEFDDLFVAAGIEVFGASPSDGFTSGPLVIISQSVHYDGGTLSAKLGYTATDSTFGDITDIWTDPDGDTDSSTTRDYLSLKSSNAGIFHSPATPPNSGLGYLLVSESAAVPEPSSLALLGFAAAGIFVYRWRKKRKQREIARH